MADYYPLIARAIAGLDPSAPGESRRALYERARAALIAQLRSVQPPLSESEITRERLSLEEAVRKVESEAAQRARGTPRDPADARRAGAAADPRAGDARADTRPPPPSTATAGAIRARRGLRRARHRRRNARPRVQDRTNGQDQRPPRNLRADAPAAAPQPPPSQPVPMQDPQLPPTRERHRRAAPPPTTLVDAGAGRARLLISPPTPTISAAPRRRANRAARKSYAQCRPSPSPEFDRLEPNMENRGADPEHPISYDESASRRPSAMRRRPAAQCRRSAFAAGGRPRTRGSALPPRHAVFPFKSAIATASS